MSIEKIIEFAGTAPESDKNTNELDLSRGFPSRLHPARQWFNYLFNTVTKKINEIIDGKLDIDANAVSASKLQTVRTVSFTGAATGSFNYDGSQNSSATLTLSNSGVTANTYGGALKIPVITVNSKGLITSMKAEDAPVASVSQLGGVKIGANINVDDGKISVPVGTTSDVGVLAVGDGLIVNNGVVSSLGLGVNQIYQDMTASRTINTTYTNTSNKPIAVMVGTSSGDSGVLKLIIGGHSMNIDGTGGSHGQSFYASFIVPPNTSYRLEAGRTIVSWLELR